MQLEEPAQAERRQREWQEIEAAAGQYLQHHQQQQQLLQQSKSAEDTAAAALAIGSGLGGGGRCPPPLPLPRLVADCMQASIAMKKFLTVTPFVHLLFVVSTYCFPTTILWLLQGVAPPKSARVRSVRLWLSCCRNSPPNAGLGTLPHSASALR